MSKQEKKPLSKKGQAEAIIIGFLIGILYVLILILLFSEKGFDIQFSADEVPISMLETISPNCKEMMSEYLVFKNFIEDRDTTPEYVEVQFEKQLKQNLYNENCW